MNTATPATRVLSLLPGTTEIVAALGAADRLVGCSHECDWPPEVAHLPRVTTTPVDATRPGAEIDSQVRALREAGRAVIAVDAARLRELAPDLVLTQSLCDVCAADGGAVQSLAAALPRPPRVLALRGTTLAGVMDDILAVADALGAREAGLALVRELRAGFARLAESGRRPRPRVACVEWLDPPYLAGHWAPELVAAAGGEDVGARAGDPSRRREWSEIAALRPEVVLVMLCGFDVPRARRELGALRDPVARELLATTPSFILDGNAFTSRPGPRLLDGALRIRAALEGRDLPGLARVS